MPSFLTAAEAEMHRWLDQARRAAALAPLRPAEALAAAARAKCLELAGGPSAYCLRHDGPRWGGPLALQRAFGVRARVMGGENLAACADPWRAFQALLASPGHRANILHPEHDAVGVAVLAVPRGVAVCQEFAGGLAPGAGR